MCVALDIVTSPYITIAVAANNSVKSTRFNIRLLSVENIAKFFTPQNYSKNPNFDSADLKIFLHCS